MSQGVLTVPHGLSPSKEEAKTNKGKMTSERTTGKKPGKRGRKPSKIDVKAKLERSRQSARECRARKKLRYQYLEELVTTKESAIQYLREELEMYKKWCIKIDEGEVPPEAQEMIQKELSKAGAKSSSAGE